MRILSSKSFADGARNTIILAITSQKTQVTREAIKSSYFKKFKPQHMFILNLFLLCSDEHRLLC